MIAIWAFFSFAEELTPIGFRRARSRYLRLPPNCRDTGVYSRSIPGGIRSRVDEVRPSTETVKSPTLDLVLDGSASSLSASSQQITPQVFASALSVTFSANSAQPVSA